MYFQLTAINNNWSILFSSKLHFQLIASPSSQERENENEIRRAKYRTDKSEEKLARVRDRSWNGSTVNQENFCTDWVYNEEVVTKIQRLNYIFNEILL